MPRYNSVQMLHACWENVPIADIGSETHVNSAPINRAVDDRRRR